LWIKKGTLFLFNAPDQIAENAHFPINGDIFASWLLLPFHTDLVVNMMNFPITLLGGISCYAIARELGLTRREASLAPALICFTPSIYSQITTSYMDNAVFCFGVSSTLFTLRFIRSGHLHDSIMALVAAGIVLGVKYTGLPIAVIIFCAVVIKTITLARCSGTLRKLGLIIIGISILCVLGGRQYILNTFEAKNPLYPFPLKVFGHQILEGSYQSEKINEWVSLYEQNLGWERFNFWEKEYRRFSYTAKTAGPKFFIFLILSLIALLTRPQHISAKRWYFFSILWIVPVVLFYTNSSSEFARRACWLESSTRFLAFPIALLIIQSLFVIKKLRIHFKNIDFLLVASIFWDLTYVNIHHSPYITLLYPFIVLIIFLFVISFEFIFKRLKQHHSKDEVFAIREGFNGAVLNRLRGAILFKRWLPYTFGFIFLIATFYFLQSYRDNTRYEYYRIHFDYVNIPRNFVNGWEFLDSPHEEKIIAMTMGWDPPGHNWFFYPLLGSWLQNDIVYISAKFKWETPRWLNQGLLRGDDLSIWLFNLKRKKVNYVLVANPWPIELKWMLTYTDEFQLVFSDSDCKIFRYHTNDV
jgi:hypothetical protein